MNLNKWKESSIFTKIGSICVLLSAISGFILGLILIDEVSGCFDMLPFDIEGFCIIYLIIYYSIDVIVFLGLLFLKKWAKSLAVWWGLFSVISFVLQISAPCAIFIAYILSIIAAICLLIGKNDFKK